MGLLPAVVNECFEAPYVLLKLTDLIFFIIAIFFKGRLDFVIFVFSSKCFQLSHVSALSQICTFFQLSKIPKSYCQFVLYSGFIHVVHLHHCSFLRFFFFLLHLLLIFTKFFIISYHQKLAETSTCSQDKKYLECSKSSTNSCAVSEFGLQAY